MATKAALKRDTRKALAKAIDALRELREADADVFASLVELQHLHGNNLPPTTSSQMRLVHKLTHELRQMAGAARMAS